MSKVSFKLFADHLPHVQVQLAVCVSRAFQWFANKAHFAFMASDQIEGIMFIFNPSQNDKASFGVKSMLLFQLY